jgi:hypothetical protein
MRTKLEIPRHIIRQQLRELRFNKALCRTNLKDQVWQKKPNGLLTAFLLIGSSKRGK